MSWLKRFWRWITGRRATSGAAPAANPTAPVLPPVAVLPVKPDWNEVLGRPLARNIVQAYPWFYEGFYTGTNGI